MIERYSRKELKRIWEDQNRYNIWLQIELAAAAAMEIFKIRIGDVQWGLHGCRRSQR